MRLLPGLALSAAPPGPLVAVRTHRQVPGGPCKAWGPCGLRKARPLPAGSWSVPMGLAQIRPHAVKESKDTSRTPPPPACGRDPAGQPGGRDPAIQFSMAPGAQPPQGPAPAALPSGRMEEPLRARGHRGRAGGGGCHCPRAQCWALLPAGACVRIQCPGHGPACKPGQAAGPGTPPDFGEHRRQGDTRSGAPTAGPSARQTLSPLQGP